jgi:hypothetical protein
MAVVLDKRGMTNVLLVGTGLYLLTHKQMVNSESVASVLSTNVMFHAADNLTVAQSGDLYSAWFQTGDRTLSYQRGKNNGALFGDPVPLLQHGLKTHQYAPIMHPSLLSQTLVLLDKDAKLSMMEHAVESGIWTAAPLIVQNMDRVIDMKAFVTHIEIKDTSGMPASLTSYQLASSKRVNVLVNGSQFTLHRKPTVVDTNERGVITLIILAGDLSSPSITLSDATSLDTITPTPETHSVGSPVFIDPSIKVFDRIVNALSSGSDIRNLKTPSGERIIPENTKLSNDDLAIVNKALSDLVAVHKELASSTVSASQTTAAACFMKPALTPTISIDGNSTFHALWDLWTYASDAIVSGVQAFLRKIEDVWHFIVKIGEECWAFLVDTVEAVGKGIMTVLRKIGATAKGLWDLVKSLLDIGDIIATSDSIKVMVNAGLVYAANAVSSKRNNVDAWFETFEQVRLLPPLKHRMLSDLLFPEYFECPKREAS